MRALGLRAFAGLVLATAPLVAPAATPQAAPAALPQAAPAAATASQTPAWQESGEASWYGPRHEGRRTTSGEVFNSNRFTAAHASLPLGTYVRVTDVDSGRSVVVKVNDREPPHGVRCIDLSHAAAARLGIVQRGIADVTLAPATRDEATELAEAPATNPPGHAVNSRHGRHRAHRSRK